MTLPPLLIRVVAPYFVAGLVTTSVVTESAPILAYMIGWPEQKAADYIKRKGWEAEVV